MYIYLFIRFRTMSLVVHSPTSLDSEKRNQNKRSSHEEKSQDEDKEDQNINDQIQSNPKHRQKKVSESKDNVIKIVCALDECGKKIKLVDRHECRCGKIYCTAHRHSFDHKCTFDYKSFGKEQIQKANTKIEGNKFKDGSKIQ